MLLNFFYGDKFYKLSLPEFYTYLQYLEDIKFPKPLLEIFAKLYTFDNNENPYEYLDELPKDFIRAHKIVYSRVRKNKPELIFWFYYVINFINCHFWFSFYY